MPFNISDFAGNINRTSGVSYSHTYGVNINPPKALLGTDVDSRHLFFRIDSVNLPSRSITPSETRYGTHGIRKSGLQANYIDITTSIILSPDLRERNFFLAWQDLIIGKNRNPDGDFEQRSRNFNTGYYDDYTSGSVDILKYNLTAKDTDDWSYKLRLVSCYPQFISGQSASWQSVEAERMEVTWAYYYFTDEFKGNPIDESKKKEGLFSGLYDWF